MNPKLAFSEGNANTHARYLPTYEDANVPYSLRLPTYRSSYIRRFHPYARYAPIEDLSIDDGDGDDWVEDMLLDIRILEEQLPLPPAAVAEERAARDADNNVEEVRDGAVPLVIDLAIVEAGVEEQHDGAENLARFSVFHRVDVNMVRSD